MLIFLRIIQRIQACKVELSFVNKLECYKTRRNEGISMDMLAFLRVLFKSCFKSLQLPMLYWCIVCNDVFINSTVPMSASLWKAYSYNHNWYNPPSGWVWMLWRAGALFDAFVRFVELVATELALMLHPLGEYQPDTDENIHQCWHKDAWRCDIHLYVYPPIRFAWLRNSTKRCLFASYCRRKKRKR